MDRKWMLIAMLIAAAAIQGRVAHAQDENDDEPAAAPEKAAPSESARRKLLDESPAVQSILESNPTTPTELVEAAQTLADLNRPQLARPLLKQLLQAKPDAKTLAALAQHFGSALFFKLARNEALAPEGAALSEAVLSAALARRLDPARLAKLVSKLHDPDSVVRQEAIIDLAGSHEAAVGPLLSVLADPKRSAEHAGAREMLGRLGGETVGPLLAVVASDDKPLLVDAIEALARLRSTEAVLPLLSPCLAPDSPADVREAATAALHEIAKARPSLAEARVLLERAVRRDLETAAREAFDLESTVDVWQWDPAKRVATVVGRPVSVAAATIAARLARVLHALAPNDAAASRLYLIALLTSAKLDGGFDKPLAGGAGTAYEAAAQLGPTVLEAVLAQALGEQQLPAATAAAQILGDIGSAELLQATGRALSPLVEAARSGDRRLRATALETILKFKPRQSFAGSSQLPQALAFFAGTTGTRKALVGHPRQERGDQLAGLLAEQGFDADVATSVHSLAELAVGSPDYELMLVDITLPRVDDLVRMLSGDPRSADVPLGLMVTAESRSRAERLSSAYLAVVPLPQSPEAMKFVVERVLATLGRGQVSVAERRNQAAQALRGIEQLSHQRQSLFDLQHVGPAVQRALFVPELSLEAAMALAGVPSVDAQRTLADVASRPVQPLGARQAAADAFRRSVERFGVLLTQKEIRQQYDVYNASAGEERAVQKVLASILDTIEQKTEDQESDQAAP